MDKVNHIKTLISAGLALLTALWGWFGWLVVAWVACLALDWITGSAVAIKTGEWSSKVAREGCWHKLGSVVAVILSGILDLVIGTILGNLPVIQMPITYTVLLCPLVLVWYILTEAGSIAENAGKLGAPIPTRLRKAIAELKEAVDKVEDQDECSENK